MRRIFEILVLLLISLLFVLQMLPTGVITAQEQPRITVENAHRLQPIRTFDHNLDSLGIASNNFLPLSNFDASNWSQSQRIYTDGTRIVHVTNDRVLWLSNPQTGAQRAVILGAVINWRISPNLEWLATVSSDNHNWYIWNIADIPLAVSSEESASVCMFTPSHSSINLRSGPGSQFEAVGYGYSSEPLHVLLTTSDETWGMARQNDRDVWLDLSLGEFSGDCNQLPFYLVPGLEVFHIDDWGFSEFSPDSRYLFHSQPNSRLDVWDLNHGRIVHEINSEFPLRYSHDGRYIITPTHRILDFDTGQPALQDIIPDTYYPQPISTVVFSPDGTHIAVSQSNGTVHLYEQQSSEELAIITLEQGGSEQVAFSPNGRWLAIVAGSRSLIVWDVEQQQTVYTIEMPLMVQSPSTNYPIFFSPDSQTLFFYSEFLPNYASNTLVAWDVQNNQMKYSTIALRHFGMDDAGSSLDYFSSGMSNQIMRLYWFYPNVGIVMALTDIQRGNVLFTMPIASGQQLVANEQFIAVLTENDSLIVLGIPENDDSDVWATPLATPTLNPTPTPSPMPTALPETVISSVIDLPDAIAGAERITSDNYEELALLTTFRHPAIRPGYGGVSEPVFSPDGSRFYTYGSISHSIFAWSTITGSLLYEFVGHEGGVDAMSLSRDGLLMVTLSMEDRTLRLWDALTGDLYDTLIFDEEYHYRYRSWFGFNADATKVIWDNPLNRTSWSYSWSIDNHTFGSQEELPATRFLSIRCDGTLLTAPGAFITTYPESNTVVNLQSLTDSMNLVWSPDGCNVLTFMSGQVSATLWDLFSGQEVFTLQGHTSRIVDINFDATGAVIVSLDADDNVRVWDKQSGEVLEALPPLVPPILLRRARRLVLDNDGVPIVLPLQELIPVQATNGYFFLSPDGTTLVLSWGTYFMVFGVPTEQRIAFASVPVRVKPSSISVRQSPSADAPVVGVAPEGLLIINGRNADGTYLYSEVARGWVRADSAYVDVGTLNIEDLPIRE
jgi:WD40 repeat protein